MYSVMYRPTIPKIDQLCLPISPAVQSQAWKQAHQKQSNPIARYQAYMNYVCLHTFLKWLKEWLEETGVDKPTVWHENDLANIWEFVNGSAILLGETRLVLIPADATEMEDLSVPREWVDNPNWKADYYLAVAVNLDGDESECTLELCGFATHRQLYHEGCYNEGDRTYRLGMEDLNTDLMVMELTLGLHLQRKVKDLPSLCHVEVEKMLHHLGNSLVSSPKLRLTVESFEKWLALLDNDIWRQQLYKGRLAGLQNTATAATNKSPNKSPVILNQWFQTNRNEVVKAIQAAGWQLYQEVFGTAQVDFAFRLRRDTTNQQEKNQQETSKVKRIDLETKSANYAIYLVIKLRQEADGKIWILPQVCLIDPVDGRICLPKGLKLIVLHESGETFDQVEAGSADNLIQINDYFSDAPGAKFCVKIVIGNASITENFVI